MTDKSKNYIERHRHWQDKSIEQLSFANNFLLTISTGLFAFLFDKGKDTIFKTTFSIFNYNFDLSLTLRSLSFLFLILSILTGVIVLISRLYDFRLTRHIVLIRQRFYEKNKDNITPENKYAAVLPQDDFDTPNFYDRIKTIYIILFVKIEFLKKSETQTVKANFNKQKFKTLRKLSYTLGTISWKWTKLQGLYILTGIVLYGLYILMK